MTDSSSNIAPAGSGGFRHLLPDAQARKKQRKIRALSDKLSALGISIAGIGVVGALTLIFVYLFAEVAPLLRSASMSQQTEYALPDSSPEGRPLHLTLERYEEIGTQITPRGEIIFFNADTGRAMRTFRVPLPEGVRIASFAHGEKRDRVVAFGLDNGQAVIAKLEYELTYPEDVRVIEPGVSYPLGEAPVEVDDRGAPLIQLAIQDSARGIMVIAATANGRLLLNSYRAQTNIFTGEVRVSASRADLAAHSGAIRKILVDNSHRNVFVADADGIVSYYDVSSLDNPVLAERVRVLDEGVSLTAMEFLVGTVSLIIGGSDGSLAQWFLVRDDENRHHVTHVRDFSTQPHAIEAISTEYTRKGFLAADREGGISIHFATSDRTLYEGRPLAGERPALLAISPINGRMLVTNSKAQVAVYEVHNPHPQVSFHALWQKVWYEGRGEPEYVWQASSATDEFEAKLSLVPLSIGTLKAALFAMLMAMPIAIMGAIYSAYFMTPRMRGFVKPTIEIMEALPTVILGFLAGLWLAPFVEENLPVVFSMLVLLPAGMLLTGYLWYRLPQHYKNRIAPGWEGALLIPVVLLVGWFCISMSPLIEVAFFGGSMRQWFTDVGITYDQRNALVVGLAMGFAVIPTIFSIAEDAVFNVPRHLTQGSLALGATAWQTVVGVVLPTASPGIFSAVMIGFGRAVGETMIVLMATGNSPVVNFNIFEGMRTLSANIAVELPETAVGSTHFRVLFLAALVLLTLTFIVNTVAELVRQRLRARYSNL